MKNKAQAEAKTGWQLIPLKSIIKAAWNYKIDNAEQKEKLKANMKRNGQIVNAIVRELSKGKYEMIDGNHRHDAFSEMKVEQVYCYNVGKISQEQAQRISIEVNETKFAADELALARTLKAISSEFTIADMAKTLPFTADEMQHSIEMTEFNWSEIGKPKEGNGTLEDDSALKTVKFIVPEETYNVWLKWKERCNEILGYDSEAKCFEFAIVEAMNIPESSLK